MNVIGFDTTPIEVVDVETFLFAIQIFVERAAMRMPAEYSPCPAKYPMTLGEVEQSMD
jgi:hypothetical protein